MVIGSNMLRLRLFLESDDVNLRSWESRRYFFSFQYSRPAQIRNLLCSRSGMLKTYGYRSGTLAKVFWPTTYDVILDLFEVHLMVR
jgi:hypothetical protein